MKASVVIPAYNAGATLPLALDALTRQNSSDFEVVVVDDASTDGTGRAAKAHAGGLDLHLLRCPENLGRALARNFGVENSRGEIVLLLDSDIEACPEYVGAHLELHQTQTRAAGVGALRYPPPLAKYALARYYSTRGGAKIGPGRPLPGRYFVSGLASFSRQIFEEAGQFDRRFSVYGEDQELGLRLKKLGANLRYLPAAVGYHHHLRPLPEMLGLLERYGRESIPRILELHPEFAAELCVDDLLVQSPVATPTGRVRNLAAAELFFRPLARLAERYSHHWLPAPLLTYLIWAAYRQGFKSSRIANSQMPS
jgi:glycosyltransferase involved in cell wall biosynthesis